MIKIIRDERFSDVNPNFDHFITTRFGGNSLFEYAESNMGYFCGEKLDVVESNRNQLCDILKISHNRLFVPREVHKNEFTIIDNNFLQLDKENQERLISCSDALITNLNKIAIAVSTADCVPVLLVSDNGYCAAIHAGWRGIVSDIIDNVVLYILGQSEVKTKLTFLVGPCISCENYEVKEDLVNIFKAHFSKSEMSEILVKKENDMKINLRKAVNIQLQKYTDSQYIYNLDIDTYSNNNFYSVRRDGQKTGRFLSGIFLK